MKQLELTPIGEKVDLNEVILDDIADRLWYEYFCPAEVPDSKVRKFIMEQYNVIAKQINAIVGFGRMQILTSSVRWQKKEDDLGPDLLEPIYLETVEFPKRAAPGIKPVTPTKLPNPPQESKQESRSRLKNSRSSTTTAQPANKPQKGAGGKSIIEQIIDLHIQGKSKKEIIEMGYNKSTVNRQVGEYIKKQNK